MKARPVRKSPRLQSYDYASAGSYFVTISTKFQQHFFGEILDGAMQLSPVGALVDKLWRGIPSRYVNTTLDAFIVMPNHLHAIIELRNSSRTDAALSTDAINRVRTIKMNEKIPGGITGAKNPMLTKGSLSNIIRWFKGRTTHEIRKNFDPAFAWHSRFYERIIRHDGALNRIREYIEANPMRWERDPYNPVRTRLIASVQKSASTHGENAGNTPSRRGI